MPPRGKLSKGSKPTRGGGKKFSRDVRPAEDRPGMWDDGPRPEESEEEEEESEEEEEDSEEESGDEAKPSTSKLPVAAVATGEMTRDERRAAQKAAKEAKRAQLSKGVASMSLEDSEEEEEEEEEAPKQKPKAIAPAQGFPAGNPNAGNLEPTMSRREREAAEAAAAKERYRKLHEAGKTEEAKSDLARLAIIKKEREEKARQRQAELDEKKRQAEIKASVSGKKLR
ncbi:hypothetical protein H072_5322 [Dactylellina haptotyla CBS 200.50]|uniref:Casein kinase substrate phosphoprotein PP28 domain-containing protein n=1 Tax=Dactylellina haptotyla (strain CBS 200.50) TaxID=1284197 RepID=S8ACU0_DACHA|nr:hypothetical protein H072_5322 [Dactylellina haptotyla CBS 200.50]